MNASKPSEYLPDRGGKCQKRLGGIKGCRDKTTSWHLIGFPDGSKIGLTVSCRGKTHRYTVCMCVCVVIPFIPDVRLVDAPDGVTQKERRPEFLHLPSAVLALIFIARRIQSSLSLINREVEFLCTHELIVLNLLSMIYIPVYIYIYIYMLRGKSQFV